MEDLRRKTDDGRQKNLNIDRGRKARTTIYKFQRLEVYNLALDYLDKVYGLSFKLPASEQFNLQSQLQRAGTSIVLNIAEGSTGQSDGEQNRFLGLALRSYLETIACFDIIERRGYLDGSSDMLGETRELGHHLFIKLQAFRRALKAPVSGPQSLVRGVPSPVSRPQSPIKASL